MPDNTNEKSTSNVLLIVMDKGIDSESGQIGYGYSPDNGKTFFVTNTIKGRKFRQEDADRLWKFLKPMIGKLIEDKFKNEFLPRIEAKINDDTSKKKSEEG